jgi:hypothetical protein
MIKKKAKARQRKKQEKCAPETFGMNIKKQQTLFLHRVF